MITPHSLRRRVAQLEAGVAAAQPLVVLVRCFTGGPHVCRITGPDGSTWLLEPGEGYEAFVQRARDGAQEAIRACRNPPAVWPLCESRSLFDRPWNKADFLNRTEY